MSTINFNRPQGAADFDFLWGDWRVFHRRLNKRLAGSDEWTEFPGTMAARPILAGFGNFDENVLELPEGTYEASTLRFYDLKTSNWNLVWIDGRNPALEVPVVGRFNEGVGTFFAKDDFEGRPILVRFRWSDIEKNRARWEQAFSENDGVDWEINWIMQFERL